MLVEKVPWCTHEGGVYTIHVQSTGLRFATGGADAQVKVWSMLPVVDVQQEKAGPLVLATLSDHTSTVNTVRFSKNGKYLASGSDDRMICIFEHKAGAGGATLGGGAASVENWRTRAVLRGHSNNVVDLGWSPDDARLASASIDNMVCIWDAASGQRLHTLDYHTSFVKGLAWDPVGTYLATQGALRPPRLLHFSTRMSWSPDGSFLATGNSYQGSSHAAVVIQRGRWNEDREHMLVSGHQGCVVSVGFNPRLFHLPKKGGAPGEVEEMLSSVFALGSQDKRVSVWAAARPTPLMVGKRFFRSQVTDLAWSPDGYTALAASSDGTVACFQFAASELGRPNTQQELDAIFQEIADQLALEAAAEAAAAGAAQGGAAAAVPPVPEPAAARQAAAAAAVPQAAAAQQRQQAAAVERALQPSAKQNMDALSARLGGMGGGEVQLGFDAPAAAEGAPVVRKRLAPEPIGRQPPDMHPHASAELMPPPPPRAAAVQQQEAKRPRPEPASGPGSGRAAPTSGRAAAPASGAAAAGGAPALAAPHIMLRGPEVPAEVVADLGAPPRLFEDPSAAAAEPRRQLRVTNRERPVAEGLASRVQAEVVCQQGREVVWSDTLRGAAVAACGTHNFAAVGLADGQLQLYSAAGRHLSAPLKLGEISSLQAEVLRAAIPRAALPGMQVRAAAAAATASRAHLEASLSTALALQSAGEYRRWLLAYARFLADQGDAGRLGEVCSSLLGAGHGGGQQQAGDVDMADAAAAAAAAAGPGGGDDAAAWQPTRREALRCTLFF
ncbi:hypothetical protein CHLNCDRAFT_134840 [Chlorella variabilis]|uniref:Protein HIRA n=1 Tax=Chlorella variabilis TaxID=554065 RepID=E1ZGX3_CHLVA|nr:hypothetical protein CHLNCDRAFT_134840 [Chlorella variabilis]EFN55015.1 hypothetical protein CHLNCDRAFT_134840 [Chlorella variabilis]|eukprot:XP_005847117.1 hypothetical protein CHLNCDRAFT_134840 [Chlorella variabilis]